MKKVAYLGSMLALLALVAMPTLAQTYDWTWETNSDVDAAAAAIGGGLAIGLIILWIVLMAVGLFFLIIWILMLVDCAKRDFPQKSTWLVILIVGFVIGLHWLAAIIYYFAVKRKFKKAAPAAPAAPAGPEKKA